MADLTVTPASVLITSGTTVNGTAGEALTAGKSVYLKASDSKWWLAQADGTAEEAGSGGLGIALHAASANQPIVVQTAGSLNVGATTAKAVAYVVSATAGGIAPVADLTSGHRISYLGYAAATDGSFVMHKAVTGTTV